MGFNGIEWELVWDFAEKQWDFSCKQHGDSAIKNGGIDTIGYKGNLQSNPWGLAASGNPVRDWEIPEPSSVSGGSSRQLGVGLPESTRKSAKKFMVDHQFPHDIAILWR